MGRGDVEGEKIVWPKEKKNAEVKYFQVMTGLGYEHTKSWKKWSRRFGIVKG